ncbi:vitamin K epoxide reductase family protein [Myxococcaceae bacterium GXIMD 01537]
MSKKANPSPPVPVRGAIALLVLGLAESVLSIVQWQQLLTLRAGGATVCGVSETVNCETVWNSAFASRLHELTGLPVAGLGLVWGLAATLLAALYLAWRKSGRAVRPAVNGLRLVAGAGVLSVAVFAAASAGSGAVCLLCLGTYALVVAFAAVAWKGLPGPLLPQAGEWGDALKWTVGLTAAAFVALLVPGSSTPRASAAEALLPAAAPEEGPLTLEKYLEKLSISEKQNVADALAMFRRASPQPAPGVARRRHGPVDAPVQLVEWTDSKCPHCKALVEALAVLKQRAPEGALSVEARHYPLDGACNPSMGNGGGPLGSLSVRCVAAKVQICLEGAPDYWELRERLFGAQAALDTEMALSIGSSGSVPRTAMDACINNPDTTRKLLTDIEYAQKFDIHGTPLVVINGREAPGYLPFLYSLILARGDTSAQAFQVLPAPRPMPSGGQGHAHPHPH